MAGVALCAIDGLLVWRVLGLVTSTLRFCGFPKAGLPSCSAPFSRGSASVLPSPSGAPFCPLSCASPSKRTFLARLLFICLAVLLALSGCPFWPLSSPNPSKRTSPACYAWLCSLLPLVVRFCRTAAQILQDGPRQLGEVGCAPCSGQFWPLSCPNPPKRTSPAWSAWLCSLLSLWWSVLAAQQPKSVKTDLPCSSNLIGLCPFLSLVLRFVR